MKPRIYTKTGDEGTTGLLYGGRVRKDSWRIELNGAVDEAQAAIGLARAEADPGSELDERLTALARDLYVLMAEVATASENRAKLTAGSTLVTPDMVAALESGIDDLLERFELPSDFTVPGENRVAGALDFARTVVRRAERIAVGEPEEGSLVMAYLNRLSDLLWAMARWQEGPEHPLSKAAPRRVDSVSRLRLLDRQIQLLRFRAARKHVDRGSTELDGAVTTGPGWTTSVTGAHRASASTRDIGGETPGGHRLARHRRRCRLAGRGSVASQPWPAGASP